MDEPSLEGWEPVLSEELSLARVIDLAFDYRGNVTVVKRDGAQLVGYLFNRDGGVPEPFIQMYDEKGEGPHRVLYSEIQTVKFTGRDTAAGKSWEAWVQRQEKERTQGPGDMPATAPKGDASRTP